MAEKILISYSSSTPSPLVPSSRIVCHVCHKQFSQYACPRCNSRYCSLQCYKSHSLRCTESFMRENVVQELQQMEPNDETKHKMLDILKRFHFDSEDEMDGLSDEQLLSHMEGRLAEELNSKSLRLSKSKLPQTSISNIKQDVSRDVNGDGDGNLWEEDESLSNVSPHKQNKASDLDREWQKRRDQFHTIGYRDGLIAGKETSAQEGFNIGFKQSVFVGCEWGIVRGVTSILASIPNELREKLINSWEKRNSFPKLL